MVIAVVNQKGGVGKTTTALSIGMGLAKKGKKVLFIDTDQQANLSDTLQADMNKNNILDVMLNDSTIEKTIQKREDIHIITANSKLANADAVLNNIVGKEFLMRDKLEIIKNNYDTIIIDTAPSISVLTTNTLIFADNIIIPIQADIYSIQGLVQLHKNIIVPVKKYYNTNLNIMGILLTRFKNRENLSKQIVKELNDITQKLDTKLFNTKIRECIAVKEAQMYQTDIYEYANTSNATIDYMNLLNEIGII